MRVILIAVIFVMAACGSWDDVDVVEVEEGEHFVHHPDLESYDYRYSVSAESELHLLGGDCTHDQEVGWGEKFDSGEEFLVDEQQLFDWSVQFLALCLSIFVDESQPFTVEIERSPADDRSELWSL